MHLFKVMKSINKIIQISFIKIIIILWSVKPDGAYF
jgi:hypothetical protein